MRYANHWGCSLRDLGRRIPAEEWPLWVAYYYIEPFGFEMHDNMTARQTSIIASGLANGYKSFIPSSDISFKAPELK
tara:strand:- start:35690 stop:35920 length:231 start_codon:yes stop_codon:yes gene_type:complete